MQKREPLTYADHQPGLPASDFAKRLNDLRIARLFEAANNNEQSAKSQRSAHISDKSMIEQERPQLVPRPTLDFAADVDAQTFNARLEKERQRAAHKYKQGDPTMSDDTTKRPTETLREGPLKAAIWRNDGENGAYHAVTLARTYKDRDGNLQDTSSFRAQDMLGLSELARRAHHHAHDLDRAAFKEQRQSQQEQSKNKNRGHTR